MKVLVLGGGVIGVTSAWYLHGAGHEVTVVDRQAGPGLETSFANGGQISCCARIRRWCCVRVSIRRCGPGCSVCSPTARLNVTPSIKSACCVFRVTAMNAWWVCGAKQVYITTSI